MPKNFIKRHIPDAQTIKNHKYLKVFGRLLHNPNLWHLNRNSVIAACSIGLFCAFIPMPFQMVLAAALAILFSANLPISVALVWISNPITMPPMFYFTYKVGALILDIPPKAFPPEFSIQWLTHELHHIWKPLYAGSLICAVIAACIANVAMRIAWRMTVLHQWRKRQRARK